MDHCPASGKEPMNDLPTGAVGQADDQPWDGGEHFFNALHDPFCFACGYGEDMVSCKTCARCYHTECMFPPLEPNQVPEVWFCPVCVARNWHLPPGVTQPPPVRLSSSSPRSTRIQSGIIDTGEQQQGNTDVSALPRASVQTSTERSGSIDNPILSYNETQAWKDAQHFKESSMYTPRGYILDPVCGQRFIPLHGNGPSIPLSAVKNPCPETSDEVHSTEDSMGHTQSNSYAIPSSIPSASQSKSRRTGKLVGNKSPLRKRYKYSDIPADIENALELIKNHLINVSQPRKSLVDVEDNAGVLEQKLKIQEGEMLICRQELEALKQKLSIELSNMERVKVENDDLRKEVQELRAVGQKREDQMKNWQNMLRGVVGAEIGTTF